MQRISFTLKQPFVRGVDILLFTKLFQSLETNQMQWAARREKTCSFVIQLFERYWECSAVQNPEKGHYRTTQVQQKDGWIPLLGYMNHIILQNRRRTVSVGLLAE
jgi:hypothetical protein